MSVTEDTIVSTKLKDLGHDAIIIGLIQGKIHYAFKEYTQKFMLGEIKCLEIMTKYFAEEELDRMKLKTIRMFQYSRNLVFLEENDPVEFELDKIRWDLIFDEELEYIVIELLENTENHAVFFNISKETEVIQTWINRVFLYLNSKDLMSELFQYLIENKFSEDGVYELIKKWVFESVDPIDIEEYKF